MEMQFILVMDKHMLTNRGFTMIEVLFCLSTIIILSTLTLSFTLQNKSSSNFETEFVKIQSLLEEAKTLAINEHQKVDIEIDSNSIGYTVDRRQRTITLAGNFYLDDIKEMYFNNNGNINRGNTIQLCNINECRSIVFNVGSGDFYLKQ